MGKIDDLRSPSLRLHSRSQASLSLPPPHRAKKLPRSLSLDAALDAFARHAMLSSVAYKEGFGARGLPVVRLRGDRAPLTAAIEVYQGKYAPAEIACSAIVQEAPEFHEIIIITIPIDLIAATTLPEAEHAGREQSTLAHSADAEEHFEELRAALAPFSQYPGFRSTSRLAGGPWIENASSAPSRPCGTRGRAPA